MDRNAFVALATAYVKETENDGEIAKALWNFGIGYEKVHSPLSEYAETCLQSITTDDDIDVVTLILDLMDDGITYIGDKEIYSFEQIWDCLAE